MSGSIVEQLKQRLRSGDGSSLKVSEVALVCGCSRSFVHKLIKAGALEHGRLGRDFRVPVAAAAELAREAGAL